MLSDGLFGNRSAKQCYGPPPAPETGATRQQLVDRIRINGNQASAHAPWDLKWFYDQVRNKAPWDYNQRNPGFEKFGNYNYGYAGARQGIPDEMLLEAAGLAQLAAGTSRWKYLMSNWDDPNDQEQIRRGINDAKNACF